MKLPGKHTLVRNVLAIAISSGLTGIVQVQAHHSAVAYDTATEINITCPRMALLAAVTASLSAEGCREVSVLCGAEFCS